MVRNSIFFLGLIFTIGANIYAAASSEDEVVLQALKEHRIYKQHQKFSAAQPKLYIFFTIKDNVLVVPKTNLIRNPQSLLNFFEDSPEDDESEIEIEYRHGIYSYLMFLICDEIPKNPELLINALLVADWAMDDVFFAYLDDRMRDFEVIEEIVRNWDQKYAKLFALTTENPKRFSTFQKFSFLKKLCETDQGAPFTLPNRADVVKKKIEEYANDAIELSSRIGPQVEEEKNLLRSRIAAALQREAMPSGLFYTNFSCGAAVMSRLRNEPTDGGDGALARNLKKYLDDLQSWPDMQILPKKFSEIYGGRSNMVSCFAAEDVINTLHRDGFDIAAPSWPFGDYRIYFSPPAEEICREQPMPLSEKWLKLWKIRNILRISVLPLKSAKECFVWLGNADEPIPRVYYWNS